jgi:hypothetical protein
MSMGTSMRYDEISANVHVSIASVCFSVLQRWSLRGIILGLSSIVCCYYELVQDGT